jgi:hypothetical protein
MLQKTSVIRRDESLTFPDMSKYLPPLDELADSSGRWNSLAA